MPVLLLIILAMAASGQNIRESRQERFFTASCDAVWPHALDAFAGKGFDPEQMDREGGFIKFEFTARLVHGGRQQAAPRLDVSARIVNCVLASDRRRNAVAPE